MSQPILNPLDLPVSMSLTELAAAVESDPGSKHCLVLRYDNDLKQNGTKALAASALLAHVGALTINQCKLDGKQLRTLFKSKHLGAITALDLGNNFFHDPGAKVVSQWPGLAGVTHLWLHKTAVGAKGLKELCGCGHLDALQQLDVSSNNIKAAGIKAMAAASFPRLEQLDLHYNPIGDAGVKALGALAGLGETLDLFSMGMTHNGLKSLLANPAISGVRTLRLSHNALTDKGAQVFAGAGPPEALRRLDLTGTSLSDKGAQAFDVPAFAQLEWLDLFQFESLPDAVLETLRESKHIGHAVRAAEQDRAARA